MKSFFKYFLWIACFPVMLIYTIINSRRINSAVKSALVISFAAVLFMILQIGLLRSGLYAPDIDAYSLHVGESSDVYDNTENEIETAVGENHTFSSEESESEVSDDVLHTDKNTPQELDEYSAPESAASAVYETDFTFYESSSAIIDSDNGKSEPETSLPEDDGREINESSIVYVTPSGKRYHFSSTCGGKNSYPVSIDDVGGRTPCKKCAG